MPATPYLISQLDSYDDKRSVAWLKLISALTGADWEIYANAQAKYDWQRQQAQLALKLNDGRKLVAQVSDWPKFYTGIGLLLANEIAQERVSNESIITEFNQQFSFDVQLKSDDSIMLPFLARQQWKKGQPVVQTDPSVDQYSIYISLAKQSTLILGPVPDFKWLTPSALVVMTLVITLLTALLVAAVWLPFRRRLADTVSFVDQVAVTSEPLPVKNYRTDELGRMEYKIACMAERIRAAIFENRQMIKAVSHDLKTPLSRMRFALEAMPMGLHGSFEWESIRRNIQLLSEYIDDIILLDGLHSDLQAKVVDPINVVHEIQYMIDNSFRSELQWLLDLPQDPSVFPIKHSHWLRLTGNLLDNAQRYAHQRIYVKLEVTEQGLYFLVDNDGPAIAEADRNHIFMPFYRSDNARNLNHASYGLGLSVCRSLAGLYQGKLQLEESQWSGTCFSLFIPNPHVRSNND